MAQQEVVAREKQRLLEEEKQVLDELRHLRDLMLDEVDIDPDEGDAEITEREKNAALIAVLENKIQDIQAALRSIEKGNYVPSVLLALKISAVLGRRVDDLFKIENHEKI